MHAHDVFCNFTFAAIEITDCNCDGDGWGADTMYGVRSIAWGDGWGSGEHDMVDPKNGKYIMSECVGSDGTGVGQ
jgi:hypothetical protein